MSKIRSKGKGIKERDKAIEYYIDLLKKDKDWSATENTLKSYGRFLSILFSNSEDWETESEKINTYPKIISFLSKRKVEKDLSVRQYFLALIRFIKSVDRDFKVFSKKFFDKMNEIVLQTNAKEEKRRDEIPTTIDFVYDEKKINERKKAMCEYFYKDDDDDDDISLYELQYYPIILFYLHLPLRNILQSVKFGTNINPLTDNYFIIKPLTNSVIMILNNYKTVKTYGKKEYNFSEIDQELNKAFLDFLQIRKAILDLLRISKLIPIDPTINNVFLNRSFKPFDKNGGFTKLIRDSFDEKDISCNVLRKIFITKHYPPELLKKIKEIERFLNHRTLNSDGIRKKYYILEAL